MRSQDTAHRVPNRHPVHGWFDDRHLVDIKDLNNLSASVIMNEETMHTYALPFERGGLYVSPWREEAPNQRLVGMIANHEHPIGKICSRHDITNQRAHCGASRHERRPLVGWSNRYVRSKSTRPVRIDHLLDRRGARSHCTQGDDRALSIDPINNPIDFVRPIECFLNVPQFFAQPLEFVRKLTHRHMDWKCDRDRSIHGIAWRYRLQVRHSPMIPGTQFRCAA